MNSTKEDMADRRLIELVKEKSPANVQQLVDLAKTETDLFISEQEIMRRVLRLKREGRIRLEERLLPGRPSLGSYLKSTEARWYWITIVLAAATVLAVFLIPENFYPMMYVRYVLGAIFVLFLPGYSLIKALFLKKELSSLERVALSVGMSMAVVPIVGLILNYTIWGITITTISLSILVLTLILATVGFIREEQSKKVMVE